jgi:pyruvate,water dikinase
LKIVPWFFIPWYLTEENYLSDVVKHGLLKHERSIAKITDMNNALMTLLFPAKDTLFQEEQDAYFELVGIASKIKDFAANQKFKAHAKSYLDRFSWTTTYLLLPLEKMTMNDLTGRIRKDLAAKSIDQYRLQKEAREANVVLVKKLMKTLGTDKALIKKIHWAQEYAWLLTRSVEEGLAATANLIAFFKEIAEAIGVPYKKWVLLTSEEIKKILDGKLKAGDIDLQAREEAYCMLLQSGNIELITGKKARELSDFVENNVGKIDESAVTFSGQPTYPGKVTGRVLIAENAEQAGRLREGEILVTSMTTPDFVPMMKKAAAVVTNEGGLLSHAAIVSRELRKPCIVGTKIATKLLKNGDLVEVDSGKGIVTIIK